MLRRTTPAARLLAPVLLALLAGTRPAVAQSGYVQTNLVSDVPGLAATLDPQLKNSWGMSFSPAGPFWVSNAGTGTSTLYNGAGTKLGLVVNIPGPGGGVPGVPTGQTFNTTGAFALPNGANANFLFAGATGTISAWNGAAGTTAVTVVNGFPSSSYTGIAVSGSGATARLYAANFGAGRVDVFDGAFNPVAGGFTDANVPAGYVPYNVQNVGGSIIVTYALKDPTTGQEVVGAGNGYVDVYDTSGALVRRLASGGALDAPWGMALAPAGFGRFGGDLLIGNFGDGTINAFDPTTGAALGALLGTDGRPLVNEGLWGIAFGNGGAAGSPDALYFAAGINDEADGLFGRITATPEPGSLALMAAGVGLLAVVGARRARRDAAGMG
ncbi:hypothetical protein tb265_07610 [Gemmatimonadetes bacterium T265]|nr:hypothetical protein tb265_07610 [Gemmatimonadetes bacterium T265]